MRVVGTILFLSLFAGCRNDDIGNSCPEMKVPDKGGATEEGDVLRAQGSEIVEYNAIFPCESAICVATLGRGAYCSSECSRDSQCPEAFGCRAVMDVGPFAGKTYCTWKECKTDDDCGDRDRFMCTRVPEQSLGNVVNLCGLRPE